VRRKMNIRDLSDKELLNELERRRTLRANKPHVVGDADFTNVTSYAKYIVNYIAEHNAYPKDAEHFLFEKVMEACFRGNTFWDWLRQLKVER
jgi:hypothetical protein